MRAGPPAAATWPWDVLLSVALAAVFGWAAYEARVWSDQARLLPLAVALPALVLAALQTVLSVRARRTSPPQPSGAEAGALPAAERARRTGETLAWIGGIFAAIYSLGFVVAVPLVAAAYLRVSAREGWAPSLIVAALCWALVYGVFDRLLHVPLPGGPLLRVFGLE